MIIKNLTEENLGNNGKRVAGEIHWEDCNRPVNKVFFEIGREQQDKIFLNASSFLLASFIPAIKRNEKRIRIDDSICTELLVGVQRVASIISNWFYPDQKSQLKIETKNSASITTCNQADTKSGFFFSGGIDSLATLLRNKKIYPKDHQNCVHYGITVCGLEIETEEQLVHVDKRLNIIADNVGIERIVLNTNVRSIDTDWQFWEHQWQGSVLASIAHLFFPSIHRVYIASTLDYKNLKPFGSHPLVDQSLGCDCMRIVHDGIQMNRLEKVKTVSENQTVLQNIRVCNQTHKYTDEYVNCGKCEKCLRTMLALHALGKLNSAKCFRDLSISSEKIKRLNFLSEEAKLWWKEFAPLLKESEDPILYKVVQKKAFSSPKVLKHMKTLRRFKKAIKVIDEKFLGRRLQTIKSIIDDI